MNKAMITALAGVFAIVAGAASGADAEERIAYKSAKSGTSYYQMGVELANAVKAGTDGAAILTVEESQGSVQNVMEAAARPGNYVFTAPPGLVSSAAAGTGPFEKRPNPRFAEIRALFPIPSLTMHFVVAGGGDAKTLADLEGKTILLGKGSFGATEGEKYLDLFGLKDAVTVADAELGNAADALKNGQIDGFVTAGSFPAPNVIEAAAGGSIALLSLDDGQVEKTGRSRQVIPAGTYAGVDADTVTTSLPVFAFSTTAMSDDTAYLLTKTFWEEKAELSGESRWWKAVDPALLGEGEVKLHPGALRYYEEAGVKVPDALK
ncbi:TAXI family TRAP transporter solute-binding subunit [Jiella avicenniae]|uniref:TAXI family TRAP transporter solute-binding subunit n=1 Tax=Jiella avicenniae TaxID=2907202 RepID=A0A9X1P1V7_9HYPH|nr:TAXI family TRAP transporter solute-binding subunit [Jiella avicenniae]MCE7027756.1 TAXI family TRAP transporter solute-binding subunit [Jiella avicenniae]MCE7028798.1 TAXI family TRAP transporter solute-binding subunit [Jiella avicenniae]